MYMYTRHVHVLIFCNWHWGGGWRRAAGFPGVTGEVGRVVINGQLCAERLAAERQVCTHWRGGVRNVINISPVGEDVFLNVWACRLTPGSFGCTIEPRSQIHRVSRESSPNSPSTHAGWNLSCHGLFAGPSESKKTVETVGLLK